MFASLAPRWVCALALGVAMSGCAGARDSGPSDRASASAARTAPAPENPAPLGSLELDAPLTDLEPLRAWVGGARVVALGEREHGDADAFRVRARMVRYLHEELGFDTLAFESGLYDCRLGNDLLRAGAPGSAVARACAFSIWAYAVEMQPLFEYLAAEAKRGRPLELVGFDTQFSGRLAPCAAEDLVADLSVGGVTLEPAALETLDLTLAALRDDTARRTPTERTRGRALLQELLAKLDGAAPDDAPEERLAFTRQWLKSLLALDDDYYAYQESGGVVSAEQDNTRDRAMADNLLYWAKRPREGQPRKVIVWAASAHLARSVERLGLIDHGDHQHDYRVLMPMGEYLSSALGGELRSLAVITGAGESGRIGGERQALPERPAESWEAWFEGRRAQHLLEGPPLPQFISLLDPTYRGVSRRADVLGIRDFPLADWSLMFDALLYVPKMHAVTDVDGEKAALRLKKHQAGARCER
ncbi:MAG: erythromycin esterase family protein [Polyangiaceae bacterium]